jgi:predicted PurR-regulated permease PerM
VRRAPEIAQTIEQKSRPLKEWLSTVQTATSKLEEVTQVQGDPNTTVVPVQSSGGGVLEMSTKILGQTLYALALALFLIAARETYRKRLILLPTKRTNRLRVARIMNETLTLVSHYLFTMTLINIGVGVVTSVVFLLLGVPYAIAWGFLFGVASFIPYIGPTITIALCAVAQLVIAPTIEEAIAAPIALLVINFIESTFVTPWLLSRRLEVSSLAVFLAVAGLAWLWGPFAAILAVPFLIVFVAVARHVPGLEPWAVLLLADTEARSDVKETGRDRFFADEQEVLAEDKVKSWTSWVHDIAVGKPKRPRPAASERAQAA